MCPWNTPASSLLTPAPNWYQQKTLISPETQPWGSRVTEEVSIRPLAVMGLEPVSHILLSPGSQALPVGEIEGAVDVPEPLPQS